jgi:probable blue pigment (indigoidine) exporter
MNWDTKKKVGLSLALFTAILFSLYPVSARAVYAEGGNAVFMMLATTFTRALVLCLTCLYTRQRLFNGRGDIRTAVTGGFFQALSILGNFMALVYLPGPIVTVIMFTHTLMLLFFMAWKKEVSLDRFTLVTTVISLIGLTLALNVWHDVHSLSIVGVAFALLAAVATMSRLYVYGIQTRTKKPAIVGAEIFLVAAFFVSLMIFITPPQLPATMAGYVWAITGSVALAFSTVSMLYGISMIGPFQFSLLLKIEPVLTSLFSALLINEILGGVQYAGMGLVVVTLALYQYIEHRRHKMRKVLDSEPITP